MKFICETNTKRALLSRWLNLGVLLTALASAAYPQGAAIYRPISDFVDAQGTLVGLSTPSTCIPPQCAGRIAVIDYAGKGNQYLISKAYPSLGTTTESESERDHSLVYPPDSEPYGLEYGEWSARWWQWILSIPVATNPALDTTGAHCSEGQKGPVWFLGQAVGGTLLIGPNVTRYCTVPAGKSILLPIASVVDGAGLLDCGGPAPFDVPCSDFTFNKKKGIKALREEAKLTMDNPGPLQLSIGGVAVPNLTSFRAQSPVFSYKLPENNVISAVLSALGLPGPEPAGTYTPAVSDGYWVMLRPLPPGTHQINVGTFTYFLYIQP